MKKMLLFPVLLLLIFTAVAQAPKIIYVNASATGAGNGTSWTDAYVDFQAGVNVAAAGDSVFVAKGDYTPDISGTSFSMKEGVKIYGSFIGTEGSLSERHLVDNLMAGDSSVLKGHDNSVIRNTSNNLTAAAVLDGFNISNGKSSGNGGGMYNDNASPTITNCTFSGDTASYYGGGLYNIYSSPTITNCIFMGNTASLYGGGMFSYQSSPSLTNCTFVGNAANYGGGGGNGGGAGPESFAFSPIFTNCTFMGNRANYGGAIFNELSSIITNCIFWGNTAPESADIFAPGYNLTLNYNYTQNDLTAYGIGNITGSIDPFVNSSNPAGADGVFGTADDGLHLASGGAAVNTGTPDITGLHLPATDLAGFPRILDGRIEMGAYEKQTKIYVNISNTSGTYNGLTWETAYTYLQTAINSAVSGDSVFVAGGNYPLVDGYTYAMKEGVKIYGSFAGTESTMKQRDLASGNKTVLIGNNNIVIDNSENHLSSAAVIDGFIITGGDGGFGGGMENISSSPTVTNCTFSYNSAGYTGGAMFNNTYASPIITNCTFVGNSSTGNAGAIYNGNHSSPMMNGCTFVGNNAVNGGGILNNISSSPVITNSVFWGNTVSGNGADIYQSDGSFTISYSYTQTDFTASSASNITSSIDPFVNSGNTAGPDGIFGTADDGLHLNFAASYFAAGSSPIDGGSNTLVPADITTDIAGADRNQNNTVDMGAYEGVSSTQALPVTIINFSGSLQNGFATLNWQSGVETGFKHFEVQKATILSSEAWQVQPQGVFAAKGSNSSYTYSTTQIEPTAYYRLRVKNNDGSSKLSAVVELSQKGNREVLLYPNPAHSYINVKVATAGSIHIYDALGRLVKSQALQAGVNSIDVHALSAGAYYGVVNGTKLNFVKK